MTQSVSHQSITESHRHLSRKTSEFTTVSQSAVIDHIRKKTLTFSCANEEYDANSELTRFMLKNGL